VSLCYGLTGGIGSGKSTVAKIFADLGVRIIDTDEISHNLTASDGLAMSAIRRDFGDPFLDIHGAMDRNKMRALVFSDADAKQRLQSILHPLILEQAKAESLSPTEAPYTLVVVPLLLESGHYRDWLQGVVVIDCPEYLQISRAIQRSGINEATVFSIMTQQMDREKRRRLADEIILNDGSLEQLQEQVTELHKRLSIH